MDYVISTRDADGGWSTVVKLCVLQADDMSPTGLRKLLSQVVGQQAGVGRIKVGHIVQLSYGEVVVSGSWDGRQINFD